MLSLFHQNDDGKAKPAVCVIMDQESPLTATSFKLRVEHEQVCCCSDIVTAFACFVSAFYIFHLKYPPTHIKTLEFTQIALLGIKDKCPVQKQVLTLVSRLNKSMKKKRIKIKE